MKKKTCLLKNVLTFALNVNSWGKLWESTHELLSPMRTKNVKVFDDFHEDWNVENANKHLIAIYTNCNQLILIAKTSSVLEIFVLMVYFYEQTSLDFSIP